MKFMSVNASALSRYERFELCGRALIDKKDFFVKSLPINKTVNFDINAMKSS